MIAARAARTAAQYALVLLAALAINFALPRLAPGNPADLMVPASQTGLTPAQRAQLLHSYGLDGPLPNQFARYLGAVAHGNLLVSTQYRRPVRDLLMERLPWTLLLVGGSVVLSTLIGSLLGFRSAWRRGSAGDVGTLIVVLLLDSTPPFFTGLLLILIFSVWLRLLPIFGALPTVPGKGLQLWLEVGKRLVLPLVALTLGSLASVYLVARSSLVSELREDYVLLAAAKGLSEAGVRRHGERNAIIPLWTITMLNVGAVFGGVAAVETVFSYPGLGRLIYDAVLARDYPVLQGAFLVIAIAVITTNIVADLFYPLLDPRVRRPAVRTAV